MNVPATIKSLFDVVPLVTYKDERLPHKGPNYLFLEEFTVAVHNVFNCKGMIIPTDPISLGIVLVLAHKNKLALPTEQGMAEEASSPLPSMHRPQTHSRSLSTKNQNTRRNQQHRRQQPRRASQTHQRDHRYQVL